MAHDDAVTACRGAHTSIHTGSHPGNQLWAREEISSQARATHLDMATLGAGWASRKLELIAMR